MFTSVLIANRGEIAVRVIRTCKRLGIHTIAIYSEADARALHVLKADEAHLVGPPPAVESYLNQERILEVARQTGAAAIHPGYGFLSENADFAERCQAAGLVWIGPPPAAMRLLGEKAPAKALAEQAGVPILPGYHGPEQDPDFLRQRADEIGYPVLVKASAGGGGRGMRVVENASQFAEALEAARREARASFGNDHVLLEHYLQRPRHVEVQVFGDASGNVVHLGERECSIQRRHQKLIEESPSPAVDDTLRAQMGEAAIRLTRAAGYQNAGTVEFILDQDRRFAFLEVNARLQVEHPVTEMVTGLDLVEWQLRVAAGEPLPLRQEQVQLKGHAMEVRLIAEDPARGFLPSTGLVNRIYVPDYESFVRVDTGLNANSEVSPYYDSLLAKVITAGRDRETAVRRMQWALGLASVEGEVTSNLDLLRLIVAHPSFVGGELHTNFLAEHDIIARLSTLPLEAVAMAAAEDFHADPRSTRSHQDPWREQCPWRVGRIRQPSVWLTGGREIAASVSAEPDGTLTVASQLGTAQVTRLGHLEGGKSVADVGGVRAVSDTAFGARTVNLGGSIYAFTRRPPPDVNAYQHAADAGAPGELAAPMPGRVVKVHVRVGDRVEANQPLLVLEAMKMEHVLEAPRAGVVARLPVSVGEQVTRGQPLAELRGKSEESGH